MTESLPSYGNFPSSRPRRMRQSEALRKLIRETRLSLDQLIMPYFVVEGSKTRQEIESMLGQFRFSIDELLKELEELVEAGISSVLLFGVPSKKDSRASGLTSNSGLIQNAVREIKKKFPALLIITDLCLCAYTDHGHCGVLNEKGEIENDPTLKILAEAACAQAKAGSDIIAPSDMMDGRVRAIREALDRAGFQNTPIMSYSAKYASAYYGPFRDAAHSAPSFGDRKTYQMDPANIAEAMREIAQDIQEGADIVMVKPALAYLDVIREASKTFQFPLAAYAVSGEYAMIKAAAERQLIDEKKLVLETWTGMVRAGAQTVITYHAKQIALWRQSDSSLQAVISQGVTAF